MCADQIMKRVACSSQYGLTIALSVVQAIQKMNPSRTGSRNTHAQASRELRISYRGKRGGLFVPHLDKAYLLGVCPKSFENSIYAIARKSKNNLDVPTDQSLYKKVCNCAISHSLSHVISKQCMSASNV